MNEQERQNWLEERKKGLGGSDSPVVLGISKWKTRRQLWEEKLGINAGFTGNEVTDLGSYLEPYVAQKYSQKTGRLLQQRHFQIHHKEYPFIFANVDREILKDDRGVGILEIKTMDPFVFNKAKNYGLPNEYAIQLQHYLMVTGREWGAFALFNRANGNLIHFDVIPDKGIHERILEEDVKFWDLVKNQTPPDDETETEKEVKLPETEKGQIYLNGSDEWAEAVDNLKETKQMAEQVKELDNEAKAKVQGLMGDNPVVEGNDVRVYWQYSQGKAGVDTKKLKEKYPKVYDDCFKRGKSSKTFKAYFLKKAEQEG